MLMRVGADNERVLHAIARHHLTSTPTPALDARGFRHQYPSHLLNYNYHLQRAGLTQQWFGLVFSDPCDSRACSGGGSRVLSTTEQLAAAEATTIRSCERPERVYTPAIHHDFDV